MPKISIEFDEDDLETLRMAAEVAERSLEDFITEEMLGLADMINIQGNLKHVTLERHRRAESAEFFQHFNKSGRAQKPIDEWAKRNKRDEG